MNNTNTTTTPHTRRSSRRWWQLPPGWPLGVMAAPAAVAIWSGWVGLGQMTGFGPVHPLPGIADEVVVNTAITLPIGVEAYSAYAMGIWLSARPMRKVARVYAAVSSLVALLLGLVGQVFYHLFITWGYQQAPTWAVVFVACLPVLVLGAGATLHHLSTAITEPGTRTSTGQPAPDVEFEPTGIERPRPAGRAAPGSSTVGRAVLPAGRARPARRRNGRGKQARSRRLFPEFLAEARDKLAAEPAGTDPSPSWCQRVTGCSDGTSIKLARALRAELAEHTNPPTHPPGTGDTPRPARAADQTSAPRTTESGQEAA